jgi:polysaccharide biosynthesis protein PelA
MICRFWRLVPFAAALVLTTLPAAHVPAEAQAVSTKPRARPIEKPQQLTRTRVPSRPRATETRAPEQTEIKRSILALYDGAEEPTEAETRIHKLLEMPLNHLGYRVTFWDLRKGLPSLAEARRHKAVATWFNERIPNHLAYLAWARSVAEARVRFVIMDFTGAQLDDQDMPAVNAFLAHLGIAVRPSWIPPSADLRIIMSRAETIGFERRIEGELPGYMLYQSVKPSTQVHAAVGRPGESIGQAAHTVVTGPGGGFAAYGFTSTYDQKAERQGWILNPFEFLSQALDTPDDGPIPDTTTLTGRRIYFSHIDGDGWNSVTQIPRPGRADNLVSEVVLDDLIKAYPDLPVSVGVIGGDVDENIAGKPRAARIAREYFRQPQVEVASHSYTHPYDWGAFKTPEQERERELELEKAKLANPTLVVATDPLRAYAKRPFDLTQEVKGALDVAAALAPAGKRPTLYLWSGNTRPFAQAIAATRAYGVRNLNGGDTRFDSQYPSVSYVSPLARQIDGQRQIYSADSNETIYTEGWSAPFDRFKLLEETVRNTEAPRRLKPFNVYYHMYSGERPESLAAVKHHLDLARASRIVPVHASQYAAIADSFFGVRIAHAGRDGWRMSNKGDLQTVRFDNAAALVPDYARSTGVLGHTHHEGSLYVALDPAHADSVLATTKATAPASAKIIRPYLIDSRWPLSGFRPNACGFDIDALQGFGNGQMTWAGLRPGAYTITASRRDETMPPIAATADASGLLSFEVRADALDGLKLSVRCGG